MKRIYILYIFIGFVLSSLGGYVYLSRSHIEQNNGFNEGVEKEDDEEESFSYYCPMHPHVQSHEPGSCPICGMDLVRAAVSTMDMEDAAETEIEAETESVEERTFSHTQEDTPTTVTLVDEEADKEVDGDGERKREKGLQTALGVVTALVQMKQVIHRITATAKVAHDPELYQAQSEYLQLRKGMTGKVQSSQSRYQYDAAELLRAAKTRLQTLGLSERYIRDLHKTARLQEALLSSQGRKELIVYSYLQERDVAHIQQRQSVILQQLMQPHGVYDGEVMAVDQQVLAQSRTVVVRLRVSDPDQTLRSGSFLVAEFTVPQEQHVVVPYDAIFQKGGKTYVFVRENNQFVRHPVQVLFVTDDDVAIQESGLVNKDVVRYSQFLFDADVRLHNSLGQPSEESSAPAGHHH